MSNSINLIEKYRKYENMLQTDPYNMTYSRKLTKYGAMLKKHQKGGTHLDQNFSHTPQAHAHTPAKILVNKPTNSLVASKPSESSARTAILIKKINDMVAYAKETGMRGGARKTISTVKGYRNMTGGVTPAEKAEFERKTAERRKRIDAHLIKSTEINDAVEKLHQANIQYVATNTSLTEKLKTLNTEMQALRAELQTKIDEKIQFEKNIVDLQTKCGVHETQKSTNDTNIQQLTEANDKLHKAASEQTALSNEQKQQIIQLQLDIDIEKKNLEHANSRNKETIANIEKQIAENQQKYTESLANIEELKKQYETLANDFDDLEVPYNKSYENIKQKIPE